MENATLNVTKTKKGKFVANLAIETKKDDKVKIVNMPFPQLQLENDELNGTQVKVLREKGKIVSVQKEDGEMLFEVAKTAPSARPAAARPQPGRKSRGPGAYGSKTSYRSAPSNENLQIEHVKSVRFAAKAPYNFIALNEKIVEVDRNDIPDFDRYHADRHTGRIDIEIETLTPLYIRGTLTEEQVKKEIQCKDSPDFFSPAGKPKIPGSSLRGMTRTLVEIASWAKFENFDDKRLYYRGLADISNLRKEYQERMSSYDRKTRKAVYMVSAGLLHKRGREYFIESCGGDFRQVLKKDSQKMVADAGGTYATFTWHRVTGGYVVVSGEMNNKKRDWLIAPPRTGASMIPVPEEDVESYRNDITRADEVPNLVKEAANDPVPCFYVKWMDLEGNERVSFGHTGMFRLAYELSIGDHVPLKGYRLYLDPEALKRLRDAKIKEETLAKIGPLASREFTKKSLKNQLEHLKVDDVEMEKILAEAALIDIPEAVFGNENRFAGRVFFEDADMLDGQSDVFMDKKAPKILSTPKPTTFQHYLVQAGDNNRQLNNYNSPAALRGYKCYWHKSGNGWEETDRAALEKHASQYTRIKAVRPGVTFSGTIRFENLSDVELGALLFALDLPEGCFHKLGMGKPLGLGSVKVTPRLYLSDRQARYQDLFAELELQESDKIPELKRKFETHILTEIGAADSKNLWETERLRELGTILNLETGRRLEKVNRYMTITPNNEFKNRPVLPIPSDVK